MDAAGSAFNPQAFLDATQTEVNERRPTIPAENPDSPDGLYMAVIGEVKADSGTIGKGDNIGKPWISMVIPLKLQLPATVQAAGLPNEFQFTDRVFLDLNAQGGIDNTKGKNRGQKAYRDALDMNKPGEAFSWRMTQGRNLKVKLVHELYEGNIVEKVAGVFPA